MLLWRYCAQVAARGTTALQIFCSLSFPEEGPVSRVVGLVPVAIVQLLEKGAERRLLSARHLHSDQHATGIRAVVPVMKQADVPVFAHAIEEVHQCAGALGKLESIHHLILEVR